MKDKMKKKSSKKKDKKERNDMVCFDACDPCMDYYVVDDCGCVDYYIDPCLC